MSGDARVGIRFEGDASSAVAAAEETSEAISGASSELREFTKSAAAQAAGQLAANAAMAAGRLAAQALSSAMRTVVAESEALTQAKAELHGSLTTLAGALGDTIMSEREAAVVSGTLRGVTDELAAAIRGMRGEQSDLSAEMGAFVLDVVDAAIAGLQMLLRGYEGVRVGIAGVQQLTADLSTGMTRLDMTIRDTVLRTLARFREELARLVELGGAGLGWLIGDDAAAGMRRFAEAQRQSANESRIQAAGYRDVADAARGELGEANEAYRAQLAAIREEEGRRRDGLQALRDGINALRPEVESGAVAERLLGEEVTRTTSAVREQTAAVEDLSAAFLSFDQIDAMADFWLQSLQQGQAARIAEEQARALELEEWKADLRAKELEAIIAQTSAIKEQIAERVAAEQAAAATSLAIRQREAGALGRVAASAAARQGDIAENFRLGVARELEARAIQYGVEAAGRFAAFDFVGGAAYVAASGAAVAGARLLGGSPSAAGQVAAAPAQTTQNVTNVNTKITATGIIDQSVVDQIAQGVAVGRERGLIT